MLRFTLLLPILLSALGCESQQTWATVEAERRRIFSEAKKYVPPAQWDQLETTVFDRPRTKPETIQAGIDRTKVLVNQKRAELLTAEAHLREVLNVIETKRHGPDYDTVKMRGIYEGLVTTAKRRVEKGERILHVAQAAVEAEEWIPVLDVITEQLVMESGRSLRDARPASDIARLERATLWFNSWYSLFLYQGERK